jgi:hypothetical protein
MLVVSSLVALSLFGAAPCASPDEPHDRPACTDLRDADLVQADLSGADLRGADLSGADLTRADLTDADLRDADLTGANLTQTNLSGADLRGATLDGVSAAQASGVLTVRVDPVGAGAYVQVGYLLLGPAGVLALVWWRRRFGFLPRHTARPAGLIAGGVGVALAVAGLYLLCVGVVRGLAAAVTGWLWAAAPGPVAAGPLPQLGIGVAALVVSAVFLYVPRRPATEPVSQLVIGKPTPGRRFPGFGSRTRGLLGLVGVLGLLDLVGVFVLWLLDLLPAWSSVLGHLVVVGVGTVVLIRAARAPSDTGAEPATLSGMVLVEESYVWLSGASASGRPANRAVPWDSLERVCLIQTLGARTGGWLRCTIRPPGAAEPVEYPNELPLSRAQAARLRDLLPPDKVTEVARAAD